MLVLARKQGEAIQIGDGITVHVVEIRGKQVRLRDRGASGDAGSS
jgi:carbon storage regulator CsrA